MQLTKATSRKEVADWCSIVRQHWIKQKPSGTIFRSKDVFSWAASGAIELSPADKKPINASGREVWRSQLSKALKRLADRRELIHPGISHHAWKVP
jgi:hypothetical protein